MSNNSTEIFGFDEQILVVAGILGVGDIVECIPNKEQRHMTNGGKNND